MVKIEKGDFQPVCPFCERKLEKLVQIKTQWFRSEGILCCPHCRKILMSPGSWNILNTPGLRFIETGLCLRFYFPATMPRLQGGAGGKLSGAL